MYNDIYNPNQICGLSRLNNNEVTFRDYEHLEEQNGEFLYEWACARLGVSSPDYSTTVCWLNRLNNTVTYESRLDLEQEGWEFLYNGQCNNGYSQNTNYSQNNNGYSNNVINNSYSNSDYSNYSNNISKNSYSVNDNYSNNSNGYIQNTGYSEWSYCPPGTYYSTTNNVSAYDGRYDFFDSLDGNELFIDLHETEFRSIHDKDATLNWILY